MKVLGYLLARLGIRLIWAVVEFVANWSLDTVNTNPLTRIRQGQRVIGPQNFQNKKLFATYIS